MNRVLPARALVTGAAPSHFSHFGTSSKSSAVHRLSPKLSLRLLRLSSTSFFAGNSSYALQPRHGARTMRSSHPATVNVIKAAFIFDWIGKLITFLARTPAKMFAQKIEDELDKASKMVKTGAAIVAKAARQADEFAEEVERIAEQTEEFAEKVAAATEKVEERIDDVLDVIEGEKKVVITGYKLVQNENQAAMESTTIAKDGDQTVVVVENSVANEKTLDKPINSP